MNTLTTIEGRVVDAETAAKPPKPKRSMMLGRRALSAGRSRVPPPFEDAERAIPSSPKKFAEKTSEDANISIRSENMGVGALAPTNPDAYSDTREETEMPKKNRLSRQETFPDDATRDDASVNDSAFEAAKGRRSERKYIERAASVGRARSTGRERFHIEYRPRYRDQNTKCTGRGGRRFESASPTGENIDVIPTDGRFDRHVSIDSNEFEPSAQKGAYSPKNMPIPARTVQAGIQETVSGLTVSSPLALQGASTGRDWRDKPSTNHPYSSPRNVVAHRVVGVTRSASSPSIVTPGTSRNTSAGFLTPKSMSTKTYSGVYTHYSEEGRNSEVTDLGEDSFNRKNPSTVDDVNSSNIPNYGSLPVQNRKEQARHRLKQYLDDIDSRVKGRRGYEAKTPDTPKPLLDGVSVDNRSKLVVPPLIDEDGVWRDPSPRSVFRASHTGIATANADLCPIGVDSMQDESFVRSLQSRVEYYKTCLKSNEKKLDELIDSENELKELLMSQREQYEIQQKQDSEIHEKEMEEVKSAMNEAKKAIDALEATIEKLNEASKEKDECIHELKTKLNEVEDELEDCVVANKEHAKVYRENVIQLEASLSERDYKILRMEEKIKKLEEESVKMNDLYSRTEAAFVDSCKTIDEKEQLLIKIKEQMEQEKGDLLDNFEKYREDLTDKMDKTSLRMEAITTEKNKLIESLHSKVQLLESSLTEKEEEVKQHDHCAEKHEELNSKIQTLALALAEKDKELSNCQHELNKERKLHAESNEKRTHAENELRDCQEELSYVRRAQAEDLERRHSAKKIAKALSSNVAANRRRHHAIQREPRQDPPVSPHRNQGLHNRVYCEHERRIKSPRDHRSRRSETERYNTRSISSIEYDSSDSIFDFSH
ncbi:hypothetical protein HJC23_002353 [Cyclotella cryptica]|uniref:Uncharacterized protein n=1 Tax=Cyclotella cryptica TaxID=29204 RepID=A0ABD3QST5_9STRA|eukprot:CCRYP_004446-RA/>CCRYP_004446-RA protein AED:0.08 eAED:0.08 QI:0/-1/0/1/-1/1/1/0/882